MRLEEHGPGYMIAYDGQQIYFENDEKLKELKEKAESILEEKEV